MAWSDPFPKVLKDNDVRLVTDVPDNVLTPHIVAIAKGAGIALVQTPCDPTLIRNRFMKGFGTGRGGALDV